MKAALLAMLVLGVWTACPSYQYEYALSSAESVCITCMTGCLECCD